jgi:fatty-acyl-CoA synthase
MPVLAERFRTSDHVAVIRDLAPARAMATPGRLQSARLPALDRVVTCGAAQDPGCLRVSDLAAIGAGVPAALLAAATAALDRNDPINIQFASRTTGLPKGATPTHRNIVTNATFVTLAQGPTEADRPCIPVPFHQCFGMVRGRLGCATRGSCMVIPGEGFDPASTLAALAEERATALCGVPTMFLAMLAHPRFGDFDLASLRTGIMAGASCPVGIMKRIRRDMHMAGVTIACGMTETSPVRFQSALDTPVDRRAGSVGRLQPHLEVRILGPDGQTVPVGTEGELATRGHSVMQGDRDDPGKTAEAITPDGWMRRGDLARLESEGGIAPSPAGSRTPSSAAAKTSRPARSRSSSTHRRTRARCRSSASPIPGWARRAAPGSCRGRERFRPRPTSAPSARAGSHMTSCRRRSASRPNFR